MLSNVLCCLLQVHLSYMFKVNSRHVQNLGATGPGSIFNSNARRIPPEEGTTLMFYMIDSEYCNVLDTEVVYWT